MSVRTKCTDLEADLKAKEEQMQKQVARLQRTLEEEKQNAKKKIVSKHGEGFCQLYEMKVNK